MAPTEISDRNPFIPIGALVVVLALAAGFGMRYGLNVIVAAVCVAIAMVGTWLLLSPSMLAMEARTAPVASNIGTPIRGKSPVDNTSAHSGEPGRHALRGKPRAAFGFSGNADEAADFTESVEAIPVTGEIEADADNSAELPMVSIPLAESGSEGALAPPVDARELKATGYSTPLAAISEASSVRGFEVRAASRIGSDHALLGDPRQDDYVVVRALSDRYLIVVVADGLGVAEHSHYGAYWASRLLAKSIDQNLRDGVPGIVNMLSRTRDELTEHFGTHFPSGTKLRSISTTLVGLIAPLDGGAAAGFRIGDSDIMLDGPTGWRSIFVPTVDPSAVAFPESIDAEVVPLELDGRCILLATDGVTDSLALSDEVAEAFSTTLAKPIDEAGFCQLLEFGLESARGDRTAVAVWPKS